MKRGRNHRPHRRQGPNINRALDSNGPDVRIRGTANQIYDKYLALARDANSSGDRVKAENYLQHAEHYFRIIKALQPQANASSDTQDADGDQPMIGGEDDRFSDARELRSQDHNGGNNGGPQGGQNGSHDGGRPPEHQARDEASGEQPDVPEQRLNGEDEGRPQQQHGQSHGQQQGQGGFNDNDREGRRRRRRPRRFPREGGEGGQGESSGEAQGDSGDSGSEPADVAAE
jgi:hypothetical protein